MPSSRWLGGNGGYEFFAPEAIASRGNCDTLFNEVKVCVLPELFAKLLTSGFEEFDIGFAVGLHFSLHDKVVIVIDLLLVPKFEFSFLFGRHAIRIVHFFGHGSFLRVEFVREESLAQFGDSEGGGEIGQRKQQETQRVFESQSV